MWYLRCHPDDLVFTESDCITQSFWLEQAPQAIVLYLNLNALNFGLWTERWGDRIELYGS